MIVFYFSEEVECSSITEAERLASTILEPVKISVKDGGNNLVFIYEPSRQGFWEALSSVKDKVLNQKKGIKQKVENSASRH